MKKNTVLWLAAMFTLSLASAVAQPAPSSNLAYTPDMSKSLQRYPLPANPSTAVRHGQYLAQAGDCAGCHTVRDGQAFAGGLALDTPFGAIYTTNITPDRTHGIGAWTFDQFYTAMHEGIAPGHRYLYPAFPFPSFSQMSKQDVQDLWTYMQTLPAVSQANHANTLRFPYSYRPMLFFWRTLFFSPRTFKADPQHDAEWNRGAYLVGALGHCGACHSPRGSLGQVIKDKELTGGVVDGWWAPNITGDKTGGLGNWSNDEIVQYLKTGSSTKTSSFGPMSVVIEDSLQYLNNADLKAIAVYLKSQSRASSTPPLPAAGQPVPAKLGMAVYEKHCSSCHQDGGQGIPYSAEIPGVYPPLANNPALTDADPRNVVLVVLNGSIEPDTIARPLPFSMPAFDKKLNDKEVAAVVNYIRNAWGHQATGVSAEQVKALRQISAH